MHRISSHTYPLEVGWHLNQMHVLCGKENSPFIANLYAASRNERSYQMHLTSTSHLVPFQLAFYRPVPSLNKQSGISLRELTSSVIKGFFSIRTVFPFSGSHGLPMTRKSVWYRSVWHTGRLVRVPVTQQCCE